MKKKLFIWSAISALLILLFVSRSSPLFVCNNWDDANSYFTMGKGMMNGLVIYKDLYDQKGPFLYLVYGLAYLISSRTFLGVFIFEVIAAAFFLYFAGRIIEQKSCRKAAFILIPILGACVYSSHSFYFGGAAEEFCLPLLALALYRLDMVLGGVMNGGTGDATLEKDSAIIRSYAVAGLCAGIVAQVKYTMLGFFAAWLLLALIAVCREDKVNGNDGIQSKARIRRAGKLFLVFVGCAIIPSIPWFIYFAVTGSLDDWYRCYIYNNLFFYSHVSSEHYNLWTRLYEMSKTLYWMIRDNLSYFAWIILGFVLQIIFEKRLLSKLSSIVLFASTYFCIFIGGNKLAYYSIPLMVLAIYGAAYVGRVGSAALNKIGSKHALSAAVYVAALVVICAAAVSFASVNTINAEYRGFGKEDVWLMEAKELLSVDDTLLEVNTVDPGLYTVTGIVPTCEYFQTNGIDLDVMFEEQKKYIKEGRTDYVLAVGAEPEHIKVCYHPVAVYEYKETDHEEVYYLYKKNK